MISQHFAAAGIAATPPYRRVLTAATSATPPYRRVVTAATSATPYPRGKDVGISGRNC